MKTFKKLKYFFLLFGLDDYFDLVTIISQVKLAFKIICYDEMKQKTLEFIKFLIEEDIIEFLDVKDGVFTKSNLSINQNLIQIASKLDEVQFDYGSLKYDFWFDLTEYGIKIAELYKNQLESLKIYILQNGTKQSVSLKRIVNEIKKVFNTHDEEEIQYQARNILPYLMNHELFLMYLNRNGNEINWDITYLVFKDQLKNNWDNLLKNLSFKNTKKGNDIIEKYLKYGGSIHEYSRYYDEGKLNIH